MSEIKSTIVDFVKVLRNADIKVSPAETLDAMDTMHLVGLKKQGISQNLFIHGSIENSGRKRVIFSVF